MKDIYAACGNVLHRGAMKHFLKEGRRAYEPEQLVGWVNRIKALLDLHVVMILEQGIIILVQMADVNGNVAIHLSQADGPAIIIEE